MELEVLNTVGLPASSVLSIRAGGSRRQAQLSTLDRPFRFNASPEECGTFKVEVLDMLGSARFAYDPTAQQYPVGLQNAEGIDAGMQVTFAMRKVEPGSDRAGDAAGPESAEPVRDEKKEQLAREYMESHGLTGFMQMLMQQLLKERPADPYAYLQKQVTKRMVSEMSKTVPADEQGLASMLSADPDSAGVSVDQLAALEREAAAASEQMRQDNKKLREATAELKAKYWRILEDSQKGAIKELPNENDVASPNVPAETTPQVAAYLEIAKVQKDITAMAQENTAMVEDMARLRATIEAVRGEIDSLSSSTTAVAA